MYTIRLFQPSSQEYAAIIAVYNAAWADERHFTGEDWQTNDQEWPPHALNQRFVVELGGVIVGEGAAYETFWEHQTGTIHLSFSVHPDHEHQGLEDLLYGQMLAFAQQQISPLITLGTETREDRHDRVRFLSARNFQPVMRTLKSALQVPNFDTTPYQSLIARVAARQIGIYALSELQDQDKGWKQKLYELRWALMQDVPAVDPPTPLTMLEFENMIFGDPGFRAEAWFIAVDEPKPLEGKPNAVGSFVGMSNLWVNDPSCHRLDTGLTGVIRGYRRCGLATALKIHTIEFAKRQNSQIIVTSNEENNPMYQINQRLGFLPIPAWVSYRKVLCQ